MKQASCVVNNSVTALYVRVSTDAQAEEGYSIEFQSEALKNYCKAKGYMNFQMYIDGGWSGSNLERPQIQRLIYDIKDKKIDRVIIYKLDRLSRSQKDTLYLIEDVFMPYGVGFTSIQENFDTNTPLGRAMVGILSTFAQFERENIRERTRSGMLERVKAGYWPGGGRIPFGYDYDTATGILVPNKDADTVRKIYSMYIEGASTYKICHVLGLKYEKLAEQILKRKSNIGLIPYCGKEYQGKHEPIVSIETYNQAIAEMQRRAKQPVYSESQYLLTGLLECGYCGAKIRYQKYKDGARMYCYSREKSRPHLVKDPDCKSAGYDAKMIEEKVINYLFENAHIIINKYKHLEKGSDVKLINEIKRQKELTETKIKRLYSLYAEEGNTLLLETIEKYREELIDLDERIELEERKIQTVNIDFSKLEKLTTLRETWPYLSFDERRAVVREYVEKVLITKEKTKVKLLV